ncbi:hypothetical protein [Acetobacter farinalis]|uniref:hypothetical protein n=1 Tax=Acetobacter farinalis TaxID=1260984 RepID=UPI00140B95C2|nr:hypothetical protein [Acetobacter farinalis]
MRNLITAAQGLDIQYIAKIGALGVYPPALKSIRKNMVPNMINGRALQWIGNTKVRIYWISVTDYAQMVVKAFQNPGTMTPHLKFAWPLSG